MFLWMYTQRTRFMPSYDYFYSSLFPTCNLPLSYSRDIITAVHDSITEVERHKAGAYQLRHIAA